jgi:hypothetical protein
MDNDFQSTVVYKSYIGQLSVIKTYYADANINVQNSKKIFDRKRKHIVGLGLYNDKEGDFFNRSRIIARYAFHLALNSKINFSTGAVLNMINYNFTGSATGASGSDFACSGSLSSSLYSSNFKLGLAINDFNNPTLRPINYEFTVLRYLTLYAEKTFILNENTNFKALGRSNFKRNSPSSYIFQLGLEYSKLVTVSTILNLKRGLGFSFDLNNIKAKKGNFDFSFAYLAPIYNAQPNASQYELNISYKFKKL